jgi:hypothetical protein
LATGADKGPRRRSRATAAIRQEIKKAMQTVTVIEGILMTPIPMSDLAVAEEWRLTRREQGRAGRPPTPRAGRRCPSSSTDSTRY